MKAYGIFRKGECIIILTGETQGFDQEIIRVEYPCFDWTYKRNDVGLTVFKEAWEAEEMLEAFKKI